MEQIKHTTKERILNEALKLFSTRGFESVTVAEIALAVGIKAPSLYKHYKSKQDIFDAILLEMDDRFNKQVSSMQMNGHDTEKDYKLFLNVSEEKLIEMNIQLFLYFLHDDKVCKFRKMLTIEQYNNTDIAKQFSNQYINTPIAYHNGIFKFMVSTGITKSENTQIMALQYYGPIYMLIALCDCHPEKEEEAIELLINHIKQFNRLYKK